MHPYLNIAIRAARKAADTIMRQKKMRAISVETKGHHDYVTELDKLSEEIIIDILHQAYPRHSFLAEEAGAISYDEPESVWVIDPIDGTTNFIHGFPNFVMSIAFMEKGIIHHGLIYHPVTGDIYTASRGQGAFLNDTRMRVSSQTKLQGSLMACNLPRDPEKLEYYFQVVRDLHPHLSGLRRLGTTALDLAYVAAGYLDGYWNTGFQIWDVAAGILLIKEAGGMVTDLQGGVDIFAKHEIVAANPKVLKALLPYLKEKSV